MSFAFAAILLGVLLIYAGVKGLSVQRLLIGDNTVTTANKSITATS